jgi:uncharacterized cofD-like protein
MAAAGSPWAGAFEYRFAAGDLQGHALGNLVIAGLANSTGDFGTALEMAADLVGSVGRVLPATSVPVVLKAESAGAEVIGQVNVSESSSITSVCVVPADALSPPEALSAIASARQVVIGPGSLFTSVLAVATVSGIREALCSRTAGRIYVCNLRPQPPETSGFTDADHVRALIEHDVRPDVVVLGRRRATGSARGFRVGEDGPVEVEEGSVCGVPSLAADLSLPDGSGHDPLRLAAVLRQLT